MNVKSIRYRGTMIMMAGLSGLLISVTAVWAHHNSQHCAADEPVTSVPELLNLYECSRCHRLTTPHRLIGPSLWKMGERADADVIRASILTPDAVVTPGYPSGLMQKRLQEIGFYTDIERYPAILDRLVAYLSGSTLSLPAAAAMTLSQEGMSIIEAGAVVWPDGQRFEVAVFHIDTHPVTKTQFAAFITNGGYTTKRYWDRIGWSSFVRRRKRSQPLNWQPDRDRTAETPVVGVTWYEADAYCRWVGKTLPAALEWERACLDVPAWLGTDGPASPPWEWTAEAIWKGGHNSAGDRRTRCAARVSSHRALEGRETGFRCRAVSNPAVPAAASSAPVGK
ncbi:MAG: SUMF1/EgtB/PvdO family nonheme iron enzyme [Candidatus Tectomicrobia bacterium]|nr:SUMF1/EgtB/PvdO family nonheme iron enzyme [Candidatus Tectomicrobia bacterium]